VNIKIILKVKILFLFSLFGYSCHDRQSGDQLVLEKKKGVLTVEAEHFYKQSRSDIRKWVLIDQDFITDQTDPDKNHAASASGGKYLKCLPDTRTTHEDKLIPGENFSNQAGELAILHYQVYINNPGKYYVWVRAFSTGTEDNGIHVGIDGTWPDSGQRMQWCEGKEQWTWDSKQRTQEVHCGEPALIYLDIQQTGIHDIQFSMREDGFEFDKFVLKKVYEAPVDMGPQEIIKQ
jgi:hypothetical protein